MRYLIVTPLLPPESGGPAHYAASLVKGIETLGDRADVVAFRTVRRYPRGVRHLLFLYLVLVRAVRADALIVLDTVSVALPAVIAGWLLGKRVVVRTGGDFVWESYVERTKDRVPLSSFYREPRAFSRNERLLIWLQRHLVCRLAHRIAFSTAWQRDLWLGPYHLRTERTAVVENVCDIPARARPRTGTCRTFLWAGRRIALKNVDLLERVFARVRTRHPGIELVLLSGVSHEETARRIKTAGCVVVPSVSEVSSNTVVEALAVGTPVICTKDTGIHTQWCDTVLFVDMSHEGELERALEAMCDEATYRAWCVRAASVSCARSYVDIARELTVLCVGT